MEYWLDRWGSASNCENRYKVAMFMYDSTFEKGVHPSEVLSEVVENVSIKNPECIAKSIAILPKNKVEVIIKRYYETPLYNDASMFYELVKKLRANNAN